MQTSTSPAVGGEPAPGGITVVSGRPRWKCSEAEPYAHATAKMHCWNDKGNDKGNNRGNDKGKHLFRPLADNDKDKGKGCKGGKPIDIVVRPLADNDKDKGGKSNLCEEGKGKEKKDRQSEEDESDEDIWPLTLVLFNLMGWKGGKPIEGPPDIWVRPLADNGKDKGKGCKGVRPLADNGKDKSKGCKSGKPIRPLADNGKDDGGKQESSIVTKFPWIRHVPKHKQREAAELGARLHALRDPLKDVDEEEEERVGRDAIKNTLFRKLAEAEHEREMVMQQIKEMLEESLPLAEELEAGSGSSSSRESVEKMTGTEVRKCGKGQGGCYDGRWRQGKNQETGEGE